LRLVRLGECSPEERERLLRRSELDVASVMPSVREIVENVRARGDEALLEYTRRFDGIELRAGEIRVSGREVRGAYKKVDRRVVGAIRRAARAIRGFHLKQVPREWFTSPAPGVRVGQLVRPIERVGIYVPGGLARYPSSLLMATIPASVAGVEDIIACTPPSKEGVDPATLVAADVAGVGEVYKVGGAQAIAAMAYGTKAIAKVDKIVGPGNVYVVAAKLAVSADVDIDFAAGPSEVLIVADDSAEPEHVALDLLAQVEHDPAAAAVLVSTSEQLASRVRELVGEGLERMERKGIAGKALERYGFVAVARDLKEAIGFANDYAPEHLQLVVERPERALKLVKNAGAVFVGPYAPVAAGDFAVGPSHILPTGGAARRCSGLSVLDFVRMPSVQKLNKRGLKGVTDIVERFAEIEGLPAHARSVRERLGANG